VTDRQTDGLSAVQAVQSLAVFFTVNHYRASNVFRADSTAPLLCGFP